MFEPTCGGHRGRRYGPKVAGPLEEDQGGSVGRERQRGYSNQCCPLPGKRVGNPTFRFFFRVVWERKKWDFPLLGFPRHTPEYIFIIFEYTGSVAETRPFRPQSPGFGTRFSPHPLGILMKSGWDGAMRRPLCAAALSPPARGPRYVADWTEPPEMMRHASGQMAVLLTLQSRPRTD